MRLRQIALVARDLGPPAALLEEVFGLRIAFRDPAVGVFGLVNVVMPMGGEFLEIVQPVREDASAARYLARRGGDAGYMVILQDADALDHRARLDGAGVKVIARNRGEGRYRFSHFHPAACAGVLLSIDSVERDAAWGEEKSDWPPAGPKWRAFGSRHSLGIRAVDIQARDPLAAAERWSMLLERPAVCCGDRLELALERGVIRFVPPVDEDGTGVVGLDIAVDEPARVLARAEAAGAPVGDGAVTICGVALRPVS
ncbi:MAG: VOC family protein [Caulobacteraceae bacterium]